MDKSKAFDWLESNAGNFAVDVSGDTVSLVMAGKAFEGPTLLEAVRQAAGHVD